MRVNRAKATRHLDLMQRWPAAPAAVCTRRVMRAGKSNRLGPPFPTNKRAKWCASEIHHYIFDMVSNII
jgi:hypothetical protein